MTEQHGCNGRSASVFTDIPRRRGAQPTGASRVDHALRCVWTGYPLNGCSCHSRIPEGVVTAAWREELEGSSNRADRFFHFIWHGGVWLAYGLKDGRVRGVCCPAHGAERAERSSAADSYAAECSRGLAPVA